MIPFEEALRVGYRSTAIAAAAARTKKLYSNEKYEKYRKLSATNPDNLDYQRHRNMWYNLTIGLDWQQKYYDRGIFNTQGGGVKGILERFYSEIGGDQSVLDEIWNRYYPQRVWFIATFSEAPNFTDDELYYFEDEYETVSIGVDMDDDVVYEMILDEFTHDIWKQISMGSWCRANSDYTGVPQDTQDSWHTFIIGTEEFFSYSHGCSADLEARFTLLNEGGDRDSVYSAANNKYDDTGKTRPVSAGGLFVVSEKDLTQYWKDRLETVEISYRG
jgi:hypothetical protein